MTDGAERLTGTVEPETGVVVTTAGEIDIVTAPYFRSLVDEAIAVGSGTVTVNVARVTFMDTRGLSVLVGAARQLNSSGRRLVVQGAAGPIRRLFTVTQLTEFLGVQAPPGPSPLVKTVARAAAEPLNRELLDAALKLVVTMAQAVVVGADGASITMPRQGRMSTVAASNDVVLDMDHDQYDSGQGPCLDAASLGERFHTDSLNNETRWPEFVPRARARGIRSIMSTPLLDAAAPLGALNIYSRTVDAFAEHEQRWADMFAAQAALVVNKGRSSPTEADWDDQIQQALKSREFIALAQGLIMNQTGCTPTQAYAELRNESVRTSLPLLQVCERVVATGSIAPPHPRAPGGDP